MFGDAFLIPKSIDMIHTTLLRAYRNFVKNKFFSSLTILGLATGMAVFLLIAQYVKFETSYEDFVPNAELIYRVKLDTYINHELVVSSAENYPAVGPALADALPEITGYTRLYNMGYKNNVVITNEEAQPQPIAFKQRKFLYADSAFLPMMGYKLIAGDVRTALAEPNSAVITQHYATAYFGKEDPLGKTLRMHDDDNNDELVKVTGVINDIPANTHLKFDILFSYETLYARKGPRPDYAIARYDQSWRRKDMYTFIQVRPGTDPQALEARFPAIVDKYKPTSKELNQKDILSLQPLSGIHLTSQLAEEAEGNGDERIVRFLGMIGLFVLVIAWINYVNLSTAKAMERAKEVGVRKVMGAFRHQLVGQFLTEAALVNLFSILVALAVVGAVLPSFNSLSGLALNASHLFSSWFLGLAGLLWIGGTLLSGFYPAVILSSFKPASILKGKLKNGVSGVFLRKSLVVFQFMASVALIAGTIIVFNQLNYMMSKDIGVNIDQVLVVERPAIGPSRENFNTAIDVFRHELKKNSSIQAVSASSIVPGMQREWKATVKKYGAPDDQVVTVRINTMDYDYMDVFKMKLLAGRAFSESFTDDPDTSLVITASAARILGFKDPEAAIGQSLTFPGQSWNAIIVGVVNDYHQVSLKRSLEPVIFYCMPYEGEFYSMRIQTSSLQQTISHVKDSWEKAFPGNPFEYFFLDDYFNRQYKNERQFGMLFTTFAALALMIGCLGLLGLSAYTATQRTKEIGIRKVLGSTEGGIYLLLSREYIKLVILAIVLAVPLVYFLMNNWIQSFPYHTPITGVVFIVAGAMVLLIALLTVSFQTFLAARANPIDSLRYE
jgi:putative ABC transport system permease protein